MRIPAGCAQKKSSARARRNLHPCLLFTALCVAQGALLETLQRCIILYTLRREPREMQLSKNARSTSYATCATPVCSGAAVFAVPKATLITCMVAKSISAARWRKFISLLNGG